MKRHRSGLLALACAAGLSGSACGRPPAPSQGSDAVANTGAPSAAPAAGELTVREAPPAPREPAGWLRVEGHRILLPSGAPFHGRGANVHDTRSCNACAFEPPRVDEVLRRIDALVDGWNASFVRLLLESYGKAEGRTHYRSLLDDPAYLEDVRRIVAHVGKKRGVYILLSLWHDPSLSPQGWPTAATRKVWQKLAATFRNDPHVLFGLVNEPEANQDGALDAKVHAAMSETARAIRAVEGKGGPHHVIVVQGTRQWARSVDYYLTHPVTAAAPNVAYEVHVYDPKERFAAMFGEPSQRLPMIIGEFGPVSDVATMSLDDCRALMDEAERREVPYLAYTFHFRCPPNLVKDTSGGTCGVGAPLLPTEWGELLKARLARPF